MTGYETDHENLVRKSNQNHMQITCQAKDCAYNNQIAGCTHGWLELDETGACIFLILKC
mgnify:CR=1 FL=1